MAENIVRFEQQAKQTVGDTTRIVGLVKVKDIVSIIDNLDLEANPRSSKTNAVTDAIQNSLVTDTPLFPFKTKGILLASSEYTELDRGRIVIKPRDKNIEGILDGGHNTLAIGLYILRTAMDYSGQKLSTRVKKWDEFKQAWQENRALIDVYLEHLREEPDPTSGFDTLVPVELLVPSDPEDAVCAEKFRNNLLDICGARNMNVQLPLVARDQQAGLYDELRRFVEADNPFLKGHVEWKPNEGTAEIKAQDIIALTWIPLSFVEGIHDESGREIQPPSPVKLYTSKGSCLSQYEKLLMSDDATEQSGDDYKRVLINEEIQSAFKMAASLPKLYDYIYASLPEAYNAAHGSYGRITAVKSLNARRKDKTTPFEGLEIDTLNPDGFIMPLVYCLSALMERKEVAKDKYEICWKVADPLEFLEKNLGKIVEKYKGVFDICDYDPQKVGKSSTSYTVAHDACEAIYKDEQIAMLLANR